MNNQNIFAGWEEFLLLIAIFSIISYYVDLYNAVMYRRLNKRKALYGLIPYIAWILIFVEGFNELDQ